MGHFREQRVTSKRVDGELGVASFLSNSPKLMTLKALKDSRERRKTFSLGSRTIFSAQKIFNMPPDLPPLAPDVRAIANGDF